MRISGVGKGHAPVRLLLVLSSMGKTKRQSSKDYDFENEIVI